MPNWSEASMAVFLPTKNADKFLDLFLAGDAEIDKNKKEFFSRTFIISKDKEIKDDTALLKIEFESAWSIYSCMMKEENDKNKNCLKFRTFCYVSANIFLQYYPEISWYSPY